MVVAYGCGRPAQLVLNRALGRDLVHSAQTVFTGSAGIGQPRTERTASSADTQRTRRMQQVSGASAALPGPAARLKQTTNDAASRPGTVPNASERTLPARPRWT